MFPTHIPNWKRLPKQVCELFELKDKCEPTNEVSASNVFFDFTEEVIPKTIDDKSEKQVTIYINKTLEVSEIVPEAVMNNTSKMPKSLPVPIKKKQFELFENVGLQRYPKALPWPIRVLNETNFPISFPNGNEIKVSVMTHRTELN